MVCGKAVLKPVAAWEDWVGGRGHSVTVRMSESRRRKPTHFSGRRKHGPQMGENGFWKEAGQSKFWAKKSIQQVKNAPATTGQNPSRGLCTVEERKKQLYPKILCVLCGLFKKIIFIVFESLPKTPRIREGCGLIELWKVDKG